MIPVIVSSILMSVDIEKSRIQSEQYRFPYHYLVDLEREDFVRNLDWGLDYLTYMKTVIHLVKKYVRGDILDVGCGDGFLLYSLARDGEVTKNLRAIGVDIDGQAIRFAQAFAYGLPNVTFIEDDLANIREQFSLMTAIETFEHIPGDHLESFVRNLDRLLAPTGHLIVSVPSKVRDVIEKHFRHYDLATLRSYFPEYDVREVHYVTARKNLVYQVIAKALANRYINLNFGIFKRVMMEIHRRFTSHVSEKRGAHIIAVFEKP